MHMCTPSKPLSSNHQSDLRRAVGEKGATPTRAHTHSCSHALHTRTRTPAGLQSDLRRAVEEKVLALELLASAEKRLVEADAESGENTSCYWRLKN